MEFLFDYSVWAAFLSLTVLEIVLGIDNVVFIALLIDHLSEARQRKARIFGLGMALLLRVAMLFALAWIVLLDTPWIQVFGFVLSAKDLLMLFGGMFLLYKSTDSIHEEITGDKKRNYRTFSGVFAITVLNIVFIDVVFSFDSIMTAIGMTNNIMVIISSMTVAMVFMLVSSGFISMFLSNNPTIKMLALSFVMMIGVFLVAEGLDFHIPKGYIYFGMALSLGVEALNMLSRRKRAC